MDINYYRTFVQWTSNDLWDVYRTLPWHEAFHFWSTVGWLSWTWSSCNTWFCLNVCKNMYILPQLAIDNFTVSERILITVIITFTVRHIRSALSEQMPIEDSAKRTIMQSLSSRSCKHKLLCNIPLSRNSRTYRSFARGGTEFVAFVVVQLLMRKYANWVYRCS